MFGMMLVDVAFLSLNWNQSEHRLFVCLFLSVWLGFFLHTHTKYCMLKCLNGKLHDDDCVFYWVEMQQITPHFSMLTLMMMKINRPIKNGSERLLSEI